MTHWRVGLAVLLTLESGGEACARPPAPTPDPARTYLERLLTGDSAALVADFAGPPAVDDPMGGRVRGDTALDRFVAERHAWLTERAARLEPVRLTRDARRTVFEAVLHLRLPDTTVALPIAVVGDRAGDGRVRAIRVYHSHWPLLGAHRVRPPLVPPDSTVRLRGVIAEYQRALAAGDVDAVVSSFEPDGYFREPSGGVYVHRGREELRAFMARLLGGGGIRLEHCTVTDDAVVAAIEFTVVQFGPHRLQPQAGLAVYERGRSGRLAAARIYDDVNVEALTWMFGPFAKPSEVNPILTPTGASTFRSPMNDSLVRWEEHATFNPAAVVKDGKVYMLYRAEDATGEMQIGRHTSRIGLAESGDGVHFARRAAPVLYPDTDAQRPYEWPGGVEDPRVVETEDGTYVLTYTQWNRDIPRLAVATSRDLIHWTKHGPAFAVSRGGKYRDLESKSGAILARVAGNRLIATRVNGTYWMYFNVPDILLATSEDLVDWTPLEDAAGQLVKVLSPRPGHFDSWLVEPGPPAILTPHGIVLLYNAGNSGEDGDATLPARVYTGGQALYDPRNPAQLLERSARPFIQPTEDYERTGQYAAGTTFVEGLVPFQGRWYLYYGTADSRVGVAVW